MSDDTRACEAFGELTILFCGGPGPFNPAKKFREYLRHLDDFPDCLEVRREIQRHQEFLREAEAREGRVN